MFFGIETVAIIRNFQTMSLGIRSISLRDLHGGPRIIEAMARDFQKFVWIEFGDFVRFRTSILSNLDILGVLWNTGAQNCGKQPELQI